MVRVGFKHTTHGVDDQLQVAAMALFNSKDGYANGFKKNRVGDIKESVDNAGIAYGFFDRILDEAK